MATDQRGNASPNAVLRGGPLDGETAHVTAMHAPIEREVDGQVHEYAPTSETDDEFPPCIVFIYVGGRPAVSLADDFG